MKKLEADEQPIELTDPVESDLYEHFSVVVDRGQSPLRIDKYLFDRIKGVSRTRIQSAAEAGGILVNDKPVAASQKVKPLDKISVVLPSPPHEYKLEPENIPIEIIYEDEDLIIVNKAPGMVVHPGSGNYTGTLVNALLYHFNQLPHNASQSDRPGLVHRIDKNTSGLLVIAKTENAMTHLAKQFFDHSIHRSYTALVWGTFVQGTPYGDEEEGTITGNIGRHHRQRMVMDVYPDGDEGKEAITHYRVIERLGYVSLIECRLETGRTHQIRVHMKYKGHPVFNDEVYGGDKILKGTVYSAYKQFIENCFKLCPRQALHAKSLGFIHPRTKKKIEFESPLPEDMTLLLDKWRKYAKTSLKS